MGWSCASFAALLFSGRNAPATAPVMPAAVPPTAATGAVNTLASVTLRSCSLLVMTFRLTSRPDSTSLTAPATTLEDFAGFATYALSSLRTERKDTHNVALRVYVGPSTAGNGPRNDERGKGGEGVDRKPFGAGRAVSSSREGYPTGGPEPSGERSGGRGGREWAGVGLAEVMERRRAHAPQVAGANPDVAVIRFRVSAPAGVH